MRILFISDGVTLLTVEPEPLDVTVVPRVGEYVFLPEARGKEVQWQVLAVAHFPMVDRVDVHLTLPGR